MAIENIEIGLKVRSHEWSVGTGYERILVEHYDRTLLYGLFDQSWYYAWDFYKDTSILNWRSGGLKWL